jgi:hypothetical protein
MKRHDSAALWMETKVLEGASGSSLARFLPSSIPKDGIVYTLYVI